MDFEFNARYLNNIIAIVFWYAGNFVVDLVDLKRNEQILIQLNLPTFQNARALIKDSDEDSYFVCTEKNGKYVEAKKTCKRAHVPMTVDKLVEKEVLPKNLQRICTLLRTSTILDAQPNVQLPNSSEQFHFIKVYSFPPDLRSVYIGVETLVNMLQIPPPDLDKYDSNDEYLYLSFISSFPTVHLMYSGLLQFVYYSGSIKAKRFLKYLSKELKLGIYEIPKVTLSTT
ncbi:hypothetical protein HK098_002454 [Nowakowskiella sp. JEL0407]|nr:hypothetical protein HK098_002454 [Nowakowskiella sp. JEL0407]